MACALVAFATLGAGSAQAARPLHLSHAERTLLTAINSARAAAGVPPLRATGSLSSAAAWQSQVLAGAGYLDHTSPDGSTLLDRLTRARWHGTTAGEDLAVAPLSRGRGGNVDAEPGTSREPSQPVVPNGRPGARARGVAGTRGAVCHRRFRFLNLPKTQVPPAEGVWPLKESLIRPDNALCMSDFQVKRIILPSGKAVEIVYLQSAPGATASSDENLVAAALELCPECDGELVHPLAWHELVSRPLGDRAPLSRVRVGIDRRPRRSRRPALRRAAQRGHRRPDRARRAARARQHGRRDRALRRRPARRSHHAVRLLDAARGPSR